MSGFSAAWLALREPFDAAARSAELADRFLAAVPASSRIVDLGGGCGANIAYLHARGGAAHRWRLVDADRALLDVAARRFGATLECVALDLAQALDPALDGADAVTCSALIDLVSAPWLDGLVARVAARRLPLLIALTYDGRMAWTPSHAADASVLADFHRDMTRDKGFGPALGPQAVARLAALPGARRVASDWRIAEQESAMLTAMIDGIAVVADRDGWADSRRATRDAGALSLTVGHQDVLSLWA